MKEFTDNEIILVKKSEWSKKEYYCDITKLLDDYSGLKKTLNHFRNYICDTRDLWDNKTLAIRVPGRTVGGIYFDNNYKITNVKIDNMLIGDDNWYPKNINDVLKQFIGKKIVFS